MKFALALILTLASSLAFAKDEPWSCESAIAGVGKTVTFNQLITEKIYRFSEETTLGTLAEYQIVRSTDKRATKYDYVVNLVMVDDNGAYRNYDMQARVWGGGSVAFAQPVEKLQGK